MTPIELQVPTEQTTLSDGLHSGFPSPADDYLHRPLDLNQRLTPHPATTFFVQVSGDSMAGDRIFNGDILIIDRAEDCRDGDLVLAVVESQFVLRLLRKREGKFWLYTSAPDQPGVELTEACEIWGRVMWSLTKH